MSGGHTCGRGAGVVGQRLESPRFRAVSHPRVQRSIIPSGDINKTCATKKAAENRQKTQQKGKTSMRENQSRFLILILRLMLARTHGAGDHGSEIRCQIKDVRSRLLGSMKLGYGNTERHHRPGRVAVTDEHLGGDCANALLLL
jgi:hypothetical protein